MKVIITVSFTVLMSLILFALFTMSPIPNDDKGKFITVGVIASTVFSHFVLLWVERLVKK